MYESTTSTLLLTPPPTPYSNVQHAYDQMETDHQDEDGVDFGTDMYEEFTGEAGEELSGGAPRPHHAGRLCLPEEGEVSVPSRCDG